MKDNSGRNASANDNNRRLQEHTRASIITAMTVSSIRITKCNSSSSFGIGINWIAYRLRAADGVHQGTNQARW
jgi:hypothetical protein